MSEPNITRSALDPLRLPLLALVAGGAAGLLAELLLLEHYESAWQWAPLVLLAVVPAAAALVWRRPSPRTIAIFRVVMAVCVVSGFVGFVLHYQGNLDFELERDPALGGLAMVWKVLRGATPALAPGALAQLGLMGLVFSYRHPALARGTSSSKDST